MIEYLAKWEKADGTVKDTSHDTREDAERVVAVFAKKADVVRAWVEEVTVEPVNGEDLRGTLRGASPRWSR